MDTDKSKPGEQVEKMAKLVKRYETLKGNRLQWDTVWQEISEHCCPRKSGITQIDYTPNNQRDTRLYDITALDAIEKAVAGYLGWSTPKSTTWFGFEPIMQLEDSEPVKNWLAECARVTAKKLANSNYYSERHEYLSNLWTFGTAAMFMAVDERGMPRFENLRLGSYVFTVDHNKMANSLMREFEFTKEQMEGQFGEDALPDTVKECKEKDKKFKIIHCVKERDPGEYDGVGFSVAQRKRFASYYIEKESKKLLKEGGFDYFPFTIGRFLTWDGIDPLLAGEWGYGPGFSILPESRQMNFMAKMMDVSIEKTVFPPLLVPDTYEGALKTSARAINPYPSGMGADSIVPLNVVGNLEWGMERMKQRGDLIRRRCHLDMFQMFSINAANNREMTAFEASQLAGEKLEAISPAFDRDATEHIQPLVNFLFSSLAEAGALPLPPEEAVVQVAPGMVQTPDPQVVMQGRLALALQALSLRAADAHVQKLLMVAPLVPAVLDTMDWDKWANESGRISGVDPKLFIPDEQRQAIREARAQAQQQAAMAQMLKDGSQAVKNAGGIEKVRELVGA
jgi:hypothetical protein